MYISKKQVPEADDKVPGLHKVLANKFYLDEIYMAVIVKPIYAFSKFSRDYIEKGLANIVFGFGTVADGLALQGKKLQNGNIGFYLFAFVFGLCSIVYYLFFVR